jgi:hypothetical protein
MPSALLFLPQLLAPSFTISSQVLGGSIHVAIKKSKFDVLANSPLFIPSMMDATARVATIIA